MINRVFFKICFLFSFFVSILFAGPADKIGKIQKKEESKNDILVKIIKENKKEQFLKLIENGFDITKPINKNNMTPLLMAVILNNTEITRLILEKGVNPNEKHNSGMTPLFYAIKLKNLDIVNLLIEKKVNVNTVLKEEKVTPLIYATRLGEPSIIYTLIKNKADINAKDKHGFTAYDYARFYHNEKIVNIILQKKRQNDDKK